MMWPPFSPPSSIPSCRLPPFLLLLLLLPPSLLSHALSFSPLSWTSPHNPCYHLDGRPRHCMSEFINAAYGVPVGATHSIRQSDGQANITALTDLHNPHNLTCWAASGRGSDSGDWVLTLPLARRFEVTYISLQFCHQGEPSDPIAISILKSMDHGRTWRPMQHYSDDCPGQFGMPARTVAQTRHQETEPLCSDPRPLQRHRGGMVLAFSTLDGRPSSPDFDHSHTLQDWVTATDIRLVFHQVSTASREAEQRVEAGRGDSLARGAGVLRWRAGSKGLTGDQMVKRPGEFVKKEMMKTKTGGENTLKPQRRGHNKGSRQGEHGYNVTRKGGENSYTKEATPPFKRGKGRGHKKESPQWRPCPGGDCDWTVEGKGKSHGGRELRRRRNNNIEGGLRQRARRVGPAPPSALMSAPALRPPLAISDLQVGGRCKCNGHASRCRRDDAGQAMCVCEHHTAGPDCDVCQDFYFDRPWQRATPSQPNPCVSCDCNGHSSKCRFSMEVFQQSGRHSGGVCLKCRHHTAGRHCQYCQNGHARNHSKPLSHRKACQSCQCHPMGAVGRWCNQTSGQCLCRDGVTGLRCNRCAPGYKQGRSPLRPCIRIQEVTPATPIFQPQYSIAEECVSYCQPSQVKVRMNVETYCLKDYVLKVQVRGKERSGPWWQFSVWVQTVFRAGSTTRVRRGTQNLWVPDRDLGCGCPALQVGRTYLLIGAEEGGRGWGPEESRLVADRSTLALMWREHWSPKLRGFKGQDKKGRCPLKSLGHHQHHGGQNNPQSGYIPPHLLPQKHTDAPNQLTHLPTRSATRKHTPEDHGVSESYREDVSQEQTASLSPPTLVCSTQTPTSNPGGETER